MTRILVAAAILMGIVVILTGGYRSYQKAQIAKSVVFQDSESLAFSSELAELSEEELVRRLLNADARADAQRAYNIGDRRLAGLYAHYFSEVPGLEPNYSVSRGAIRKKLLVSPRDEKVIRKARMYCAEYNALILEKVTGASHTP